MRTSAHGIAGSETEGNQVLARALCRTMAALHRRGWCDGTGGNFSVVVQRTPELRLLMAPSGVDKGTVRPNELILIGEQGRVLSGQGKISAEMPLHRTIALTTGAGAVLHTHSQAATLLSQQAVHQQEEGSCHGSVDAADGCTGMSDKERRRNCAHVEIAGLEMLKGLSGIQTHESHIHIPTLANDQDLDRLSEAARPHLQAAPYGILIAGHGLYAWGVDLKEATRHLEILEFLLEQHWRQRLWNALLSHKA